MTKDTIDRKYWGLTSFAKEFKLSVYHVRKACLYYKIYHKKIPADRIDDIVNFRIQKEPKEKRKHGISVYLTDSELSDLEFLCAKTGKSHAVLYREFLKQSLNK